MASKIGLFCSKKCAVESLFKYECVSVWVCVCVCECVCVCVYVCVCVSEWVRVCVSKPVCECVWMCECVWFLQKKIFKWKCFFELRRPDVTRCPDKWARSLHALSHSLSDTHAHSHTHTHALSLSLTLTHTQKNFQHTFLKQKSSPYVILSYRVSKH